MLLSEPGHSATVLVALATSGVTPSATIAGNVSSVPPPAMAFTAPAPRAAASASDKRRIVTPIVYVSGAHESRPSCPAARRLHHLRARTRPPRPPRIVGHGGRRRRLRLAHGFPLGRRRYHRARLGPRFPGRDHRGVAGISVREDVRRLAPVGVGRAGRRDHRRRAGRARADRRERDRRVPRIVRRGGAVRVFGLSHTRHRGAGGVGRRRGPRDRRRREDRAWRRDRRPGRDRRPPGVIGHGRMLRPGNGAASPPRRAAATALSPHSAADPPSIRFGETRSAFCSSDSSTARRFVTRRRRSSMVRAFGRSVWAATAAILWIGAACRDSAAPNTEPSYLLGDLTGNIAVKAATTGSSLDANGYTVTVDVIAQSKSIPTNGSVTFSGVVPGVATVSISGVASNCTVSGGNLRVVTVPPGGTVSTTFSISCAPTGPTTGSLSVTTATSGASGDLDPDGYTVTLDGTTSRAIGINASVTFTGLTPGSHSVVLSGVVGRSTVSGGTSRTVSVTAGSTASTSYSISCAPTGPTTGSLSVTTATSGASGDLDPDGYTVTLDGTTSRAIGINASVRSEEHTSELQSP